MSNSDARSESNFSADDPAILTPSSESSESLYNGPPSVEKLADIVKEICKRLPWHLGGNFHHFSEQISQMGVAMADEARESRRLRREVDRLSKEVDGLKENHGYLSARMYRTEVAAEAEEETSRLRKETDRLAKEVTGLRREGAEQKEQISFLQKQVRVLHEERIADQLKQFFEKKSLEFLQKKSFETQREPGDTPQEGHIIDPQSESNRDKEPGNVRSEEHIHAIRSQLDDQKEMMSRLPKTINEELRPQLSFDPQKIGFFDPSFGLQKDGSGECGIQNGAMIYRNVELFIDAAEAASRSTSIRIIRKNLQHCLLGPARIWYVSVLTNEERDEVATGDRLLNWTLLLRKMWDCKRLPPAVVDRKGILRLTGARLQGQYSTMEFLLKATRFLRRIGVEDTRSQLLLFHENMEPSLQEIIDPPFDEETLNTFIIRVDRTIREKGWMSFRADF
ncbi:hypothetical protein HDK90DRAFT_527085 [Phyllosticta capitalensis]|uniref:Uncharacterized protein n=1 Tax=Phyllosticta capitalensis TaxID=121624 RepID=A0ABR1YIZ0_9PEZI